MEFRGDMATRRKPKVSSCGMLAVGSILALRAAYSFSAAPHVQLQAKIPGTPAAAASSQGRANDLGLGLDDRMRATVGFTARQTGPGTKRTSFNPPVSSLIGANPFASLEGGRGFWDDAVDLWRAPAADCPNGSIGTIVMFHHITHHSGTHICNKFVRAHFATSKFACIGMSPPSFYLDSAKEQDRLQWISHERPFPAPGSVLSSLFFDDKRASVVWGLRHPLTRMLGNKRWAKAVAQAMDCRWANSKPLRGCARNVSEARRRLLAEDEWWDNYGLRWVTGYGKVKKGSALLARIVEEGLAHAVEVGMLRLSSGAAVLLSEWLPQSLCVLCKVFRLDKDKCRAQISAENSARIRVAPRLNVSLLLSSVDNETAAALVRLNRPEIQLYWFGVQLAFRQFEHYNCSVGTPEEV